MTDTPKFEVIDRRKRKAEEEEKEVHSAPAAEPQKAPVDPPAGPRLVVNESVREPEPAAAEEAEMQPPPTAEESRQQKKAYEAAALRLEELVRAQNPAMGAQPAVSFEHLVQQFYVSAMIQMGAGTQDGQRPRVDILGARQTIDLMGVLEEKTRGNLSEAEESTLQAVLFEVRMAFLELTNMISLQGMQPPMPPPPGKR
jgi:type IV secretory pathway VirB10-like protein